MRKLPGACWSFTTRTVSFWRPGVSTDTPLYRAASHRDLSTGGETGTGGLWLCGGCDFRVLDTTKSDNVEMKDGVGTPEKPEEPKEPEKPGEHPASEGESQPQEIQAPKLGDRSPVKDYILILILILAAAAAMIFQYKRDVESEEKSK